jgi:hypothetical protein
MHEVCQQTDRPVGTILNTCSGKIAESARKLFGKCGPCADMVRLLALLSVALVCSQAYVTGCHTLD